MERERPEYLPPIEKPRWSFPWLTVIGVSVLTLAFFGIKQHLATQTAWNQRFNSTKPEIREVMPSHTPPLSEMPEEERKAYMAVIRQKRERAELDAKAVEAERKSWRCINHIPFRQIPGGWENVPGESC